jgi:predicted metal-dependent phosphoesterase TrpH
VLADLHLHTWCSDGLLSPPELLAAVRQARLDVFAITDHDTIAGYLELRGEPGLVSGVEATAQWEGREVHLVGLGFRFDDTAFTDFLARSRIIRENRLKAIIAGLPNSLRRDLTLDDLRDGHAQSLGRTHLAQALVARGRSSSAASAFERHLGDDRLVGSDLPPFPPPGEVAAAIRAGGGVAILAHPGLHGDLPTVERLLALGCDGLETNHPGLDPALAESLATLALQRGLLESAGSDLHFLGARRPGLWNLEDQRWEPLRRRLGFG